LSSPATNDLDHIEYTINGGAPVKYRLPIPVIANATICAVAVDTHGNRSDEQCKEVKIDHTAPIATVNQEPAAGPWTNQNVTVTITATDDEAGLPENACIVTNNPLQLAIDLLRGRWGDCTTTVSQNDTVYYAVRDRLNNITTSSYSVTNIDKVNPTVTGVDDEYTVEKGDTTWVLPNAVCDDNASGVASCDVIGVDAIDVDAVGDYTVTITATDEAGNVTTKTVVIHVRDTTPPAVTKIDFTKTQVSGTADMDAEYVYISIDGGVAIEVTVNGGNWKYTFPTELGAGTHTVVAYAIDVDGNSGQGIISKENSGTLVVPAASQVSTTPPISNSNAVARGGSGNLAAAEEDATTEEELVTEETETSATDHTDTNTDNDTDGEVLGDEDSKQWSVANLILAIGTVLVSVIVLIGYLGKGDDEKKNGVLRALTLIPTAGAVVAFLLTEDWSLPIAFVDVWTILMVAIAAVSIVLAVVASRGGETDKD
jgi:hypothetical protein